MEERVKQRGCHEELIDVIFYVLDASRLACPSMNMDEMFMNKLEKNRNRPYQYGEGHRKHELYFLLFYQFFFYCAQVFFFVVTVSAQDHSVKLIDFVEFCAAVFAVFVGALNPVKIDVLGKTRRSTRDHQKSPYDVNAQSRKCCLSCTPLSLR